MTLLGIDSATDLPARPRAGRLSVPVLCRPPEPAERSWQERRCATGRTGTAPGTGLLAALGLREGARASWAPPSPVLPPSTGSS